MPALFLSDEEQQRELQMAANRREMERRSLDILRVYNPLDIRFNYMHDSRWHSVEPKSYKDITRALAAHYFKKIAQHIIGEQQLQKGEELLKLREKQFGKTFLDKYEENKEVWDRVPRLDDPDLLKQIYETVIIGVVEEYGMEVPEEIPRQGTYIDYRSQQDQLFYTMPDKRISKPLPGEVTNE